SIESRGFSTRLGRGVVRRARTYTPPWNGPSRDHHPAHSRVVPPPYLIHPHRLLEAFRDELAAVCEQEAFARAQTPDGVGDEDLAALGLRGDARGEDDSGAEEVAVFLDRLPGIQS